MTRINWKTDADDTIGTIGDLRYLIRKPDRTVGWRVWCQMVSSDSVVHTIGGLFITAKAPDLDAAKFAAECHARNFIEGLIGNQGMIDLIAENERLKGALSYYADPRNYQTAIWDDGSDTRAAIPMIEQGDGSSYCDCGDTARNALKPTRTDTTDA